MVALIAVKLLRLEWWKSNPAKVSIYPVDLFAAAAAEPAAPAIAAAVVATPPKAPATNATAAPTQHEVLPKSAVHLLAAYAPEIPARVIKNPLAPPAKAQ